MKPYHIQELVREVGQYGVLLTPDQAETIVSTDPALVADIEVMGVDTSSREWMLDVITHWMGLQGRWPTGGDTYSYAAVFYVAFRRKAEEKGLRLSDTFGRL